MTIDLAYVLELVLNGLMLGLLYALIAVGLALIFGVLQIVNFAHGELMMLGSFTMALLLPLFGLSYWPSLAMAVIVTALVGAAFYQFFLSRVEQTEFERSILITLGLSMVLLYGAQYIFSATPRMVDTSWGFEGIEIGAIRMTWTRITGGAVALVAFAALYVLLKWTQLGRAMRAVAQNREAALMVGLKPRVVSRNAVTLAAGLCGLAGGALAPIQLVQPGMGQAVIFKAFALVIIAGLGNIPGAIATSLALGMLESWIGGFYDMVWQEGSVFVIMIVAIILRPEGLFQARGMRVG
ncbi:MAG: branched-chain amino acid ABC transporter permease [Methylobacteriaceae bacterium]|nr:branched-chain amino acid ABC transporter permease [Methylobacteriaceae bacterium]MBV9395444.1 branched-chain amino acid ABC transporter permease [Methylobacteriaceae bacterium]